MRALVNSGFYSGSELEEIEAVSNATIGNSYLDLGKLDSALYFIFHVYEYALKIKDTQFLTLSPYWLAGIYSKNGKNDSSFYYFRAAINYAKHSDRTEVIPAAELGIADLYFKIGKTDSAFYYVQNSINGFRRLDDSASLIDAYSLVSKLYQTKHRFDSAFIYLQHYVTIRDRIINQKKISETQNFIFNQTFHEQQIDQAKREAEEQYKTKIKLYILSAVILVILTVAILLVRNISIKRAANIQLRNQKREVEEQKKIAENALTELKTTQAQLIQSEKLAPLGELTAGIAHEIQNPLNFVNNFAQVNAELIEEAELETDAGNTDEVKKLLRDLKENQLKINQHGQRADAIVKGMLQHSRVSSGQKEPTDLNVIVEEYLRLSYQGVRVKEREFKATLLTDLDTATNKVNLVPQDIGRVLLNMYNNAFYAVSEKKKQHPAGYEPTVSVSTRRIDNKVSIRVRDNGNGIPPNLTGKIFQPFFTTKPPGLGTGLGLSLSYDIVKAHGGEIKVDTKESDFTEFTIVLPL
jgi:signal transduction histidine kinase